MLYIFYSVVTSAKKKESKVGTFSKPDPFVASYLAGEEV